MATEKDIKEKWGELLQYSYGLSQWAEEPGKYSVKGDIVSLVGPANDTVDFIFDYRQKTLCNHSQQTVNGVNVVINLYLKKY